MTTPAIVTTAGLAPPSGEQNLRLSCSTGTFALTGVAAGFASAVGSGLHAIALQDGTHGDFLYLGSTFTGSNTFIAYNYSLANFPLSRIQYLPTNTASQVQALDIVATNARLTLRSEITGNTGINPQIVLADTNVFGVPVLAGANQAGIGFIGNGKAATSALNVNFVNLGGSGSGAYNSSIMNIWGTSSSGDTQNLIAFYNGAGTDSWNGTMGATAQGARLGEIAGFGSLPDTHFTETETGSINFYAAAGFTGTTADGTYRAPTNLVIRLAPNDAPSTSPMIGPERITAIFDYNANLLLGDNAAGQALFSPGSNVISGVTRNSVVFGNTNDPSGGFATGGILYVKNGALKYKGSAGTVTTLGAA